MIGRLLSWWRARRDRRLGLLGSDPPLALVRRNHERSQRENATAELAGKVDAMIRENEEARRAGPCVSCGSSNPYPGACPSTRDRIHRYAPRGTQWAGRQGKEP